jgi:hypothetical protein
MTEFVCTYSEYKSIGLTEDHQKTLKAENAEDAYKKFVDLVGLYNKSVFVLEKSSSLGDGFFFENHLGKHPQESTDKENSNLDQPNIDAKTQDLDIAYQESGWATFLNVSGVLNLILFVIGGIWLLNASSSEQFAAMNLTIIGLVAAINCFFFSFLVNIFTRIQHNTHQTTILLSKLIDKTESKY